MASKTPGAKPVCVPHSSCVCVQFCSFYAVPQEAFAAFLSERAMGASPQALYSAAEPILSLPSIMPACAVSPRLE